MARRSRRQHFGQHFLRDAGVCNKIVDETLRLAGAHSIKNLIEIGPGKGALTNLFLQKLPPSFPLIAIEKDERIAKYWDQLQSQERIHGLELIHFDFLKLKSEDFVPLAPFGVVSNLPYSTGTAILLELDRWETRGLAIPFMLLMFQKEVAQRLRAAPDSKAWGSLSIWIQNRWDVTPFLHVHRGAFNPPPKVESEVVVLTKRAEPRLRIADERRFQSFLKMCFSARRKMLRAVLTRGTPYYATLEAAGIDGTKRAEALGWEEWQRLIDHL